MNKKQREQIRQEFIEMIKKSWTYEVMTEKERKAVLEELDFRKLFANKKTHVWEELNNIYLAFCNALDCGEVDLMTRSDMKEENENE